MALLLVQQDLQTTALHLLDVGQGDAILLRSGATDVLVDGGRDATVLQRLGEVRPAWDRTIDIVVLTHPQLDHLAGLVPVLRRSRVRLLLLPEIPSTSPLFAALLAAAREQGTVIRFAYLGQQLSAGNLTLTILAPDADLLRLGRANANNGAVVIRADIRASRSAPVIFSALLTGDIERAAEQHLVRHGGSLLDVDVLKVAHHGSKTSTSTALLRVATPALALMSVGAGNSYGHPAPGVLQRLQGIQTLRTDQKGTISLVASGGKLRLVCARDCSFHSISSFPVWFFGARSPMPRTGLSDTERAWIPPRAGEP